MAPPRSVMQRVETELFPEFYADAERTDADLPAVQRADHLAGPELIQQDIANSEGGAPRGRRPPRCSCRPYHPARSGSTSRTTTTRSDEAFVMAAADALRHEYRAIVDAGFVLQLDDPGLAMGWNRDRVRGQDDSTTTARSWRSTSRRSITPSSGLPADRVRLHTCWGNGE